MREGSCREGEVGGLRRWPARAGLGGWPATGMELGRDEWGGGVGWVGGRRRGWSVMSFF